MSDWVTEPLKQMKEAANELVAQGVEYVNVQMVERDEKTGYSRDLRIIVENKSQEGEDAYSHVTHKERHPSAVAV